MNDNLTMNPTTFKVTMENFNTYKVGLINSEGLEPPLYTLDVNFSLHGTNIERIHYGTMSGEVPNSNDTTLLREYMQSVGNGYRGDLRNSLETYKCHFYRDANSGCRLDFRSFQHQQKYIVVCFIWKNTVYMKDDKIIEQHRSPSCTYYIDPEHSSILYDIYKAKGI